MNLSSLNLCWGRFLRAPSTLFASVALVVLLWTTSASGQAQCGKYEEFVKDLAQQYGEEPRYTALTNAGWTFELYTSEKTKTWTILIINPKGLTCIGGAGVNWQVIEYLPGERA
jgi:hypothetical protein